MTKTSVLSEKNVPLKTVSGDMKTANWADKLWGIWGIFRPNYQHHFGTVSPLSIFSIIQPLFLQKTKPLDPHPKYLFGIGVSLWAAKN
jgi:hypothetical protein